MEGHNNNQDEREDPVIRTMAGDIKRLGKKGAPPEGLPVASLVEKEQEEREKEVEKRKMAKQEAEQKARQEAERMRQAREKAEEEARQKQKQAIEEANRKEEAAKEQKEEKQQLGKEISEAPKKERKSKKLILVVLIIVFLAAGLGGFIYWWNYLKPIPPLPETHYECQDSQCVSVEGEGVDECQVDQDCQSVEPPESLIPVTETTTIDLSLEQLKSAAVQEQISGSFKRVSVKKGNQCADLETLFANLDITIPENVLGVVTPDYTLFLYGQDGGNRLGIAVEMDQSETLVQDLKEWEETMVADLRPMLLSNEVPAGFTEEFQDNLYQGTAIRYMNFPTPDLSLDYAIINNKLIITTSRESMYAVIDTLLSAQVDISNWIDIQE